jgi:Domain of Unknown Function (DUF928)
MKMTKLVLRATFFVLFAYPLTIFGASDGLSSHMIAQDKKKAETASDHQPSPQEKKSGSGIKMPVYIPPLRGAPAGRVGGGTRGSGEEKAYLLVLAPDHVGLTAQEQPSLYWFLSAPTEFPVEFTLIEGKAAKPLIERRLDPLKKPGVQRIRLADYGLNLQDNVLYQWFITLIPDPERRSKDILSGGFIQRTQATGELRERLDNKDKTIAVHIYAEAGLWYDAFMTVCHLIETFPDDVHLRQMRASLLEQVGLDQVAKDLK